MLPLTHQRIFCVCSRPPKSARLPGSAGEPPTRSRACPGHPPHSRPVRSQVSSLLYPLSFRFPFFFSQKGAEAQRAEVIHKRQHGNYVWGRGMVTREAQSTGCCAPGGWTGRNAGARTWVLSCSGQGAMNMQRWLQQHLFLPKPGRSWAKRAWPLHFRSFTTQLSLLLLLLIVLCMFIILSPEGSCFVLISCCIRRI